MVKEYYIVGKDILYLEIANVGIVTELVVLLMVVLIQLCDLILGYNIYINNNMTCGRCKNALLIKTTLIELQKINNKYESGFSCNHCQSYYKDIFCHIYHCFKCDTNICQKCAFNTIKNKELVFPYLPSVQFVNPNEPKGGNNGTKTDEN